MNWYNKRSARNLDAEVDDTSPYVICLYACLVNAGPYIIWLPCTSSVYSTRWRRRSCTVLNSVRERVTSDVTIHIRNASYYIIWHIGYFPLSSLERFMYPRSNACRPHLVTRDRASGIMYDSSRRIVRPDWKHKRWKLRIIWRLKWAARNTLKVAKHYKLAPAILYPDSRGTI